MGTRSLKIMEEKKCNKCGEIKPVSEYHKNGEFYYSMCKICKKEYRKNNYERETKLRQKRNKENAEIIRERKREYRKNSEVYKKYRLDNGEKYKEYCKNYYQKNKEKLNKQKLEYFKTKYKTNNLFRLSENIRRGISLSFKNNGFAKNNKTLEILGCSFEEFKSHIESKFESWMTWDNYGLYNGELNYGWDIDHIIPSSSAITEEDIIKLNHYTNLQPLCSKINRDVKKDKIVE
jgi:hypothetical protein